MTDSVRGVQCGPLATVCCLLFFAVPSICQTTLYENGRDADQGFSHVNFGAATADSFFLPQEATITNVILTIYDVNDLNNPLYLRWTVTTNPFGGTTLGDDIARFSLIEGPYITNSGYYGWKMSFATSNLTLPAGTYYLQIQDVLARWDTWTFWADSYGPSTACHSDYGASEYGNPRQCVSVPSQSFAILGQWTETTPQ